MIKITSIDHLQVGLITTKTKVITYTDEELDGELFETQVTIPLKKPLLQVQAVFVVDQDLEIGGAYADNNTFIYRAIDKRRLSNNDMRGYTYELPIEFHLIATYHNEGK